MFRAPQSEEVLKTVLGSWEHHPEHTDAYVAFLENYQRNQSVIKLATKLLEANYPYDYVQGEFWKLIARMGMNSELHRLIQLAIETIKDSNSGTASRFGTYVFLCQCDKTGLGNYEKWVMYEKSPIVQAFVAPHLGFNNSSGIDAGKLFMSRSVPDSYLGLVKPLVDSNLDISIFGNNPADFPVVAQHTFKAAGLSGHEIPKSDAIKNLLGKRYNLPKWSKWQYLFKNKHQDAYKILKLADAYFETHFSTWLNYQDVFNDLLFRVFQDFLSNKNAPGAISLVDRDGKILKYGVLLDKPDFKNTYPDLYDDLYKVHRRRNHLLSSHAIDEKTGEKAQPLKKKEQSKLIKYLDNAFTQIIKITEDFGI